MKPTVELLQEQFTHLIGPEAFAKAEAAIAAAKAAAEFAAKAAAEKAAAAAKLAAEKAAAAPTTPTATAASRVAAPAAGRAGTPLPASPVAAPAVPATAPAPATPGAERSPRPTSAAPVAVVPRPAAAAAPAAPRPAPVPAGAATPLPTLPVQRTAHAAKGYDFDAVVTPDQVVQAAHLMDAAGFGLDTITGVDWIAQNEMEVVYDFFHPIEPLRAVVRTRVPRAKPELPTLTAVFPGANWHERETHDFFGIVFTSHPNLKPFLLPDDADFHPLRKDYQP